MHHAHNVLGFVVVSATFATSMKAYAHVNWEQKLNAHSVLGLIALIIMLFVGVTGLITSCMMQFYKGD